METERVNQIASHILKSIASKPPTPKPAKASKGKGVQPEGELLSMTVWGRQQMGLELFYKPEKNEVLFKLFQILVENLCKPKRGDETPPFESMQYQKICDIYNKENKQSNRKSVNKEEQLKSIDVAGYCKKLMKLGIITIGQSKATSEKTVSMVCMESFWAKHRARKAKQAKEIIPDSFFGSLINQTTPTLEDSPQPHEVPSTLVDQEQEQADRERENQAARDIFLDFQQNKLTMRECLIRVLLQQLDPNKYGLAKRIVHPEEDEEEEDQFESISPEKLPRKSLRNERPEIKTTEQAEKADLPGQADLAMTSLQQQGYFTLIDISRAMLMQHEEKTMSRVLTEVMKVHKSIGAKANRLGKKFLYTYHLDRPKDVQVEVKKEGEVSASSSPEQKLGDIPRESTPVLKHLLNQESFERILSQIRAKYSSVISLPSDGLCTPTVQSKVLIEYFRRIMTAFAVNQGSTRTEMRGRRSLTTQQLDRYVFCLNLVQARKFIPMIDLIKEIKNSLEANLDFQIDKKTVRRIVDHLKSEGLVALSDVKVTFWVRVLEAFNDSESSDMDSSMQEKSKLIPVVHLPGYTVSEADIQQYESLKNPFRIKEEKIPAFARADSLKRENPFGSCDEEPPAKRMKMEAGFVDRIEEREEARIVLPMPGEGPPASEEKEASVSASNDLNMSFIKTLVDPPADKVIPEPPKEDSEEEVEILVVKEPKKSPQKPAKPTHPSELKENEHFVYRTVDELRQRALSKVLSKKLRIQSILQGAPLTAFKKQEIEVRRNLILQHYSSPFFNLWKFKTAFRKARLFAADALTQMETEQEVGPSLSKLLDEETDAIMSLSTDKILSKPSPISTTSYVGSAVSKKKQAEYKDIEKDAMDVELKQLAAEVDSRVFQTSANSESELELVDLQVSNTTPKEKATDELISLLNFLSKSKASVHATREAVQILTKATIKLLIKESPISEAAIVDSIALAVAREEKEQAHNSALVAAVITELADRGWVAVERTLSSLVVVRALPSIYSSGVYY